VTAPVAYPGLSGKVVRSSDVGGSLKILSGLIGALGGGTLGLDAQFKSGSTVTFEYGNVTMTEISPVALEQYLRSGEAPPEDSLLGRYLSDHLFIATRVLRARKFSINVQRSNGQSIGVDLPVIQNAVGAAIKVTHSGEAEATITFEGDQDVAFAFEAYWVREDDGELYLQPTKAGKVGTTRKAAIVESADADADDAFEAEDVFATDDVVDEDDEAVDVPFVSLGGHLDDDEDEREPAELVD
jgi:hypothetical protein